MKKMLALIGACSPAFLFAAGEGSLDASLTGAISTWLSGIKDDITGFFTTNLPVILSIVGLAVVIGLVWVVFKFVRKGQNKIG